MKTRTNAIWKDKISDRFLDCGLSLDFNKTWDRKSDIFKPMRKIHDHRKLKKYFENRNSTGKHPKTQNMTLY